MPRSDRDNQQIRASRREEILPRATRVFAEKGFASTKVTDIAAAAELSHGLLYHYFPSKEAVFEAITLQMMQQAESELHEPYERAIDRIASAIRHRYETLQSDEADATRVITQAVLQGATFSEELQRRVPEHLHQITTIFTALLERAQRDGDIDDEIDAGELTRLLVFLFRGFAIRVSDFPIDLPQPDSIFAMLRFTPAGRRRVSSTAATTKRKRAAR